MRDKLTSDNIDYKRFDELLKSTDSVVAGSYVLQAITGQNWIESDIDIWTKSSIESLAHGLIELGYSLPIMRDPSAQHVYTNYSDEDSLEHLSDYSRLKSTITSFYVSNKVGSPTVQVILVNDDVSIEDVVKSFDLSICANIYRGNGIQSYYIKDIEEKRISITNEASSTQSMWEWLRTLRRIGKYMSRGYTNNDLFSYHININLKHPMLGTFIEKWNDRAREINTKYDSNIPLYYVQPMHDEWYVIYFDRLYIGKVKHMESMLFKQLSVLPRPNQTRKTTYKIDDLSDISTCYDIYNLSDEKIDEYLSSNTDNIILYSNNRKSAYCYNVSHIKDIFNKTKEKYCYDNFNIVNCDTYSLNGITFNPLLIQRLARTINKFETFEQRRRPPKRSNVIKLLATMRELIDEFDRTAEYDMDDVKASIDSMKEKLNRNYTTIEDVYDTVRHIKWNAIIYRLYTSVTVRLAGFGLNIDTDVYYNCNAKRGMYSKAYVLLRLAQNYLVPLQDVYKMMDAVFMDGIKYFELAPAMNSKNKQVVLTNTASHGASTHMRNDGGFQRGNHISSDHCQDGTDKLLYRIKPTMDKKDVSNDEKEEKEEKEEKGKKGKKGKKKKER